MKRAALYLRVSSDEQTYENQRPELEDLARARRLEVVATYAENASVAKPRAELARLMLDAHRGLFDVVLVWALDRIGRSMIGNIQAVLELERRGVEVVSLREPWLDTRGPVRPLLLAIFGWIAEQERERLGERTRAGMERVKRTGKSVGRPSSRVDVVRALELRAEGLSVEAVARRVGCSTATLKRRLHSSSGTTATLAPGAHARGRSAARSRP